MITLPLHIDAINAIHASIPTKQELGGNTYVEYAKGHYTTAYEQAFLRKGYQYHFRSLCDQMVDEFEGETSLHITVKPNKFFGVWLEPGDVIIVNENHYIVAPTVDTYTQTSLTQEAANAVMAKLKSYDDFAFLKKISL